MLSKITSAIFSGLRRWALRCCKNHKRTKGNLKETHQITFKNDGVKQRTHYILEFNRCNYDELKTRISCRVACGDSWHVRKLASTLLRHGVAWRALLSMRWYGYQRCFSMFCDQDAHSVVAYGLRIVPGTNWYSFLIMSSFAIFLLFLHQTQNMGNESLSQRSPSWATWRREVYIAKSAQHEWKRKDCIA